METARPQRNIKKDECTTFTWFFLRMHPRVYIMKVSRGCNTLNVVPVHVTTRLRMSKNRIDDMKKTRMV